MAITPKQKFTAPFICQGNHIVDHLRDMIDSTFESEPPTKKQIMQLLTVALCEEYTKGMLELTENFGPEDSSDDYFDERDKLAIKIALKAKLITRKQIKDAEIEL